VSWRRSTRPRRPAPSSNASAFPREAPRSCLPRSRTRPPISRSGSESTVPTRHPDLP
jgi:hypothetical protein